MLCSRPLEVLIIQSYPGKLCFRERQPTKGISCTKDSIKAYVQPVHAILGSQ